MAWLSWCCAAPTNISHGHVIQTLRNWLHSGGTAVKYSVDQTFPSMWKSAGSHDNWPHCKMALQHLTVLEINRWLDYTHIFGLVRNKVKRLHPFLSMAQCVWECPSLAGGFLKNFIRPSLGSLLFCQIPWYVLLYEILMQTNCMSRCQGS